MVQCTHEVLEEACAAEEPPGEERLTILLWQAQAGCPSSPFDACWWALPSLASSCSTRWCLEAGRTS